MSDDTEPPAINPTASGIATKRVTESPGSGDTRTANTTPDKNMPHARKWKYRRRLVVLLTYVRIAFLKFK